MLSDPTHRRDRGRRRRKAVAALACAGLFAVWGPAAPGRAAAAGPAAGRASYDETPTSAKVCPTAVTSTAGTVSGARNLLCGHSGGATLTLAAGGSTPTIVLDYGRDVGGIPYFDVAAATGSPALQAGYSEGLQYESATGDGTSPWAEGDSQRYDKYTVSAPGVITNQYVQGGERYEELTLQSPGTLKLSAVGIRYIADRTEQSSLPGYFDSSSSELNKIWYDSEYTDQLDSVPDQSLPGTWTVADGALQASGSSDSVGLLDQGGNWTDYTADFDAQVITNQAGWVVRGKDADNGYVFILNDSADTAGTPNELQELYLDNGNYTVLGDVALPGALAAGTWHAVSTTVSGDTVTVRLDGVQLTSLTESALAGGTVGFREYTGEKAGFKNLSVTGSSGAALYGNALNTAAALKDFAVPGVNQYASIVDGAKRDRAIWVGDMNVETPAVFYSTDDAGYLKGSLQALGSYELTSGFVTGDLPPQNPVNTAGKIPGTTASYSASYSMYFVLGLEDYYLYSGDTAFVNQEWPIVRDELAWNASQLDANGLFVTDGSDGADWDYYDGVKTGEVTEYNLLYYKALQDGATLAAAAGDQSEAAAYTAEAAALKQAVNAHLYDSATGLYYLSNGDTADVAQDANSLAVLYGVAPASDDGTILAALKTDLWTTKYGPRPFSSGGYADVISPFVSGYELDASYAANDSADAETLLDEVWGGMIAPGPDDTGTMWENINGTDGTPGFGATSSLAHGWSTTPVAALSGYVLGVQPDSAGYATWTVQPHPGDLTWAGGRVPTPHGAVDVQWTSAAGKGVEGGEVGKGGEAGFDLTVTAPKATVGTIAVPTGGAAEPTVTVNGHVVWSHGRFVGAKGVAGASADSGYVYLTGVQPGTYHVAVSGH